MSVMNDNSLAARSSHQQVLARQMTSMPPMKKTVAEHDEGALGGVVGVDGQHDAEHVEGALGVS